MNKSKKPRSAEIINPGLGDIEKVRDILFGKYVASFEQRFADLEARLEGDVDQLKDRLTKKIGQIDDMLGQAVKQLDAQLADEQKSRDTEVAGLQEMLQSAETTLQHSISMMEDQANQDLSTIRASLKETQRELLDQVEAQKAELEHDKVGRQALALMLDEVAIKLRGS